MSGGEGDVDRRGVLDFLGEGAVDRKCEAEPGDDVRIGGVERDDDEGMKVFLEVGEAARLGHVGLRGESDQVTKGADVFVFHRRVAVGEETAVGVEEGDDGRADAARVALQGRAEGLRVGVLAEQDAADGVVAGHHAGAACEKVDLLLDGVVVDFGGEVEVGLAVGEGVAEVGAGDEPVVRGERGEEEAEQQDEEADAETAEAEKAKDHGTAGGWESVVAVAIRVGGAADAAVGFQRERK